MDALESLSMTDTGDYAGDLCRIVNKWRVSQHRHMRRADRQLVAPTLTDVVDEGMVRCAWVLCHAYGGAHHIPSVKVGLLWVEVAHYGDMATTDGDLLTRLVVACHDVAVRLSLTPCGPRHIRIMLHCRVRTGGIRDRHPTLENATALLHERWAPCPVVIPDAT